MLRRKLWILGSVKDYNDREYIARKKYKDVLIQVKANEDDIYNISSCVPLKAADRYFKAYSAGAANDFDFYNDRLHSFISQYVYVYHAKQIYLNNYKSFKRNHILFSCLFEVVEIYTDGTSLRFKQ